MSNVTLTDLIKGRQVTSFVSNEALRSAMEQSNTERTKKVADQLVKLIDRFVVRGRELEGEAVEAEKAATMARKVANESARALEYLAETGNPLPFFAASHDRCAGVKWCQSNGLEVPDARDAAWSVPENFVAGAAR